MTQLNLITEKSKTLDEQIKEDVEIVKEGLTRCDVCNQLDKNENIFFVCGGNIFPNNFYSHENCYLGKLKEKGFFSNLIEGKDTLKLFSETTGIETINLNEVVEVKVWGDGIFANIVFPYTVRFEYGNDNGEVFGITKEVGERLKEMYGLETVKIFEESFSLYG